MNKVSANSEIMAWSKLPEPDGTNYTAHELEEASKVVQLFGLCQLSEAAILSSGWKFLFSEYGLVGLIEIDAKSKWMYDKDLGNWISRIVYEALISGFNPLIVELGDYDVEQEVFYKEDGSKMKVNWQEINDLKNEVSDNL